MKRAKRLAFAFATSSTLAAFPALAQQRESPRQPPGDPMQGSMDGRGMMDMHGMMMGGMGDAVGRERPQLSLALQNRADLALTEPQVKTLEGLVERFRDTAEKRVGAIEAAETELAALLKQDSQAGPQVETKVRAIEKLRTDLRLERIRTIAQGRAALAPEQRTKLDQLVGRSGMPGMDRGSQGGSSASVPRH